MAMMTFCQALVSNHYKRIVLNPNLASMVVGRTVAMPVVRLMTIMTFCQAPVSNHHKRIVLNQNLASMAVARMVVAIIV